MSDYIIGQSVVTKYNKMTYKVEELRFDMSPESRFELQDGRKITFSDYLKSKYKLTVTNSE